MFSFLGGLLETELYISTCVFRSRISLDIYNINQNNPLFYTIELYTFLYIKKYHIPERKRSNRKKK